MGPIRQLVFIGFGVIQVVLGRGSCWTSAS
jgi:hypothetical protein